MATKYFVAIADQEEGEANWSITFPGFPGVTSVAERRADIVRQARDALATAIEDMQEDGVALPPSLEDGEIPDYSAATSAKRHYLVIPAEVAGRALRVNVSLDEGLLSRIDEVSTRTGVSRSALLARGARMVIAAETLA